MPLCICDPTWRTLPICPLDSYLTLARNMASQWREYFNISWTRRTQYTRSSDMHKRNQLVCYVDTSHADSDDLRTTVGYVIYLNGGPISWRTLLHKGHYGSLTESECMGMYHAVLEVLSLRHVMEEIWYAQIGATIIHEDNEGSIKIATNPRCHDRLKHVELKYRITRDVIEAKHISVIKIATTDQGAGLMTKPLARVQHWHHANKMLK